MEIRTDIMKLGSIRVGDKYEILAFDDAREMRERPVEKDGRKFYPIRALRKIGNVNEGELGGWIEEVSCLSPEGDCWIDRNSYVCAGSCVKDNAKLSGNVTLKGESVVSENAILAGHMVVLDSTFSGDATVIGNLMLMDCKATGKSAIFGDGCAEHLVAQFAQRYRISGFGNEIQP